MPYESPDARRKHIFDEIAQLGFCLPGSVVERTSRCGNPSCRCHTDPSLRHGPYRSWTRKVQGKIVTRRLSDDQLQRYQPWFDNARRLRHLSRRTRVPIRLDRRRHRGLVAIQPNRSHQ
jgi:hypothetical protein